MVCTIYRLRCTSILLAKQLLSFISKWKGNASSAYLIARGLTIELANILIQCALESQLDLFLF